MSNAQGPANTNIIAIWCDCGKPISGFAGVIKCECGALYSVARMRLPLLERLRPHA